VGAGETLLMLVLLDSNVFLSALLSPNGTPAHIVHAWRNGRFRLLTCQEQIEEVRAASRYPKFRKRLLPHHVGTMVNSLYEADIWRGPTQRKHVAADPTDSFLLDLIDAAQPDFAVTGDKRSGLLQLGTMGRTRILSVSEFGANVLHLRFLST